MYSDKKNILQLVALLIEHGISNIIVCPGIQNAPILQTLINHPFFHCHAMTDERSAGFFALGLALHGGKPAAVCCASGSALLNIHPAVAEAYYQKVQLVVISTDQPEGGDRQALPQPNVFGSLVKKFAQLPEIHTEQDECSCNRLINEALLELNHHGKGPVHIHVPISDSLFHFTGTELPKARVITRYQGLNVYDRKYDDLIERLNKYSRRMMIAGQMSLIYLFEKRICKLLYKHFTWLTEHLSNRIVPGMPIKNFESILYATSEKEKEKLTPEIVITYGGHIVSRRLKEFLRQHPPKEHWHVSLDGEIVDPFGCLTTAIEMDPFEFLERIAHLLENRQIEYPKTWEYLSKNIPEPSFAYSEMAAIGKLIHSLPVESALHLGNGSPIRYAQLYTVPETVEVCCNRGMSGADGSLSTAIGYASASKKLNFIVIGDISFFHDMNALWNEHIRPNLRILLLNNGGSEFLQSLPDQQISENTLRYVTASHQTSAKGWAKERGFSYTSVHNEEELEAAMSAFTQTESPTDRPLLLEVFTNRSEDLHLLNEYYLQLQNKGTHES